MKLSIMDSPYCTHNLRITFELCIHVGKNLYITYLYILNQKELAVQLECIVQKMLLEPVAKYLTFSPAFSERVPGTGHQHAGGYMF